MFRLPQVRSAALVVTGCGAATCLLLPQAEPAQRVCRAAGVAALVGADYQWLAFAHPSPPLLAGGGATPSTEADDAAAAQQQQQERDYLAARSATHARSAERLRALCDAHGGLWVKV